MSWEYISSERFLVGAYKPPRQLVWVSGVMILLFVPTFIITGDLLPWDQKGYWSTQVRLSIIGSIPFIGEFIVRLLQGGPLTGIVALTRFYVLHILFLPVLLSLLIAIHFHFLRHRGLSDSLSGDNHSTKICAFFPGCRQSLVDSFYGRYPGAGSNFLVLARTFR